jgi:hypothetical protein
MLGKVSFTLHNCSRPHRAGKNKHKTIAALNVVYVNLERTTYVITRFVTVLAIIKKGVRVPTWAIPFSMVIDTSPTSSGTRSQQTETCV